MSMRGEPEIRLVEQKSEKWVCMYENKNKWERMYKNKNKIISNQYAQHRDWNCDG